MARLTDKEKFEALQDITLDLVDELISIDNEIQSSNSIPSFGKLFRMNMLLRESERIEARLHTITAISNKYLLNIIPNTDER